MRRETTRWDELVQRFRVTFTFEHETPTIDATLQVIQTKIFSEEGMMEVVPLCNTHKANIIVHELLECCNVDKEEQDEEDPRNLQVPETEGEQVVEGPKLESTAYTQPIKTQRVNIGTTKNPKFAQIGDYWSDEIVENIADLLREYQDLFQTTFSEMKGVVGDLGEMKIPLKLVANLVRQRLYKLNPKYKEKVRVEIDRMLDTGIIEPIEES
jgi:hypothetical protein